MNIDPYEAPLSDLDKDPGKLKPNHALRILCWLVTLLSFGIFFRIGVSHNSGEVYAFGYGLAAIISAVTVSLPFYLFRYFRRPNPKRFLYVILVSLFTLTSIPTLMQM